MRGPVLLCASILALQQLCGVNAVMFYSTPVLKPLMPALAGAIGISITFINALMTVVAIFLVDVSCYDQVELISAVGKETFTHGFDCWNGTYECFTRLWVEYRSRISQCCGYHPLYRKT